MNGLIGSLCDYYGRVAASEVDVGSPIAKFGWEADVAIPFILTVTMDGRLVSIEDTRKKDGDGRLSTGRRFDAPVLPHRTNNVRPRARFLVDFPEYIADISDAVPGKTRDNVLKKNAAFRERLARYAGNVPEIRAVLSFLESPDMLSELSAHPEWGYAVEIGRAVTFRIAGSPYPTIFGHESVKAAVAAEAELDEAGNVSSTTCADCVTGEECRPVIIHPVVKDLGKEASRASLVAFNNKTLSAYGRKNGENAPMSRLTAVKYTSALNHLLRSGSPNKVNLGGTDFVFWSESRDDFPVEKCFADFMGVNLGEIADDPNAHSSDMRSVLASYLGCRGSAQSVSANAANCGEGTQFRIVGLSVKHQGRISIVMNESCNVASAARNFVDWMDDICIYGGGNGFGTKPTTMRQILSSLKKTDKMDLNKCFGPWIFVEMLESVLTGRALPRIILGLALDRCRSDRSVGTMHARILKAYVNRSGRVIGQTFGNYNVEHNAKRKIGMSLDKTIKDSGYLVGRVLALCERIQHFAGTVSGGNKTVVDKYFRTLSSTPRQAFNRVIVLARYHLSAIGKSKPGLMVALDRELASVVDNLRDVPCRFTQEESAMFVLGFYQQKQESFRHANNANPMAIEDGCDFSEKSAIDGAEHGETMEIR